MQEMSPTPNRAARRAQKFKRGLSNPVWGSGRVISDTPLQVAQDCAPLGTDATAVSHAITLTAFGRLRDGTADDDDFARMHRVLRTVEKLAADIDPGLAQDFAQAIDALHSCKSRKDQHGRYGFSGPELLAMQLALSHQEVIVNHSSAKQLRMAYRQVNTPQ